MDGTKCGKKRESFTLTLVSSTDGIKFLLDVEHARKIIDRFPSLMCELNN